MRRMHGTVWTRLGLGARALRTHPSFLARVSISSHRASVPARACSMGWSACVPFPCLCALRPYPPTRRRKKRPRLATIGSNRFAKTSNCGVRRSACCSTLVPNLSCVKKASHSFSGGSPFVRQSFKHCRTLSFF
jgi:hypothetical protein